MDELGQFLQQLIDRDPKSLSTVLIAQGFDLEYDDKPTVDLLIEGYLKGGEGFVENIAVLMPGIDDLLHAEGGTLVSKLTSIFEKAQPYIAAASQAAGALKNKGAAPSTTTTPPAPSPQVNTKKIIIIGVIVVVVLIVTLVVIKKLKKS